MFEDLEKTLKDIRRELILYRKLFELIFDEAFLLVNNNIFRLINQNVDFEIKIELIIDSYIDILISRSLLSIKYLYVNKISP